MPTFKPTHHRLAVLAYAASAICMSAHAADPAIDAGSLLRQTEQALKTPKKSPRLPARKATPSTVKSSTAETVQVNSFKFVGNTLISSDKLNSALASFTNRPLTLAQLQEAANAATTIYREAGWTVRTFLPKQEIDSGIVTLQIVEAVFGGATLQSATPQRIDAARLLDMAEANLVKGQPLHANDIDRTLLLLDDLPGVSISGNLVPGQRDGETDLAISAADEAWFTGNASIDNQGSRSTGTERLSMNLSINSPARMGDALTLNALKTQGSDYQRAGYTVPVGYSGWRAGINASHLNYDVLDSYQTNAGTHGTADTTGVDASYPLVRSQLFNLNTSIAYARKRFDNYAANLLSSNYKVSASTLSVSGNQIDNWGNGGVTNASIQFTSGHVDRTNSADFNSDQAASGLKTHGDYSKLSLSLSRLQTLTSDLSFFAAATHQAANKNLDSSEKIYLGGANGVRAYPSSEAGGSEGHTFTAELRQRLGPQWLLTGFYDYGRVTTNKNNYNAANPNSYNLQGYGTSVAWQGIQNVEVKATLSQRMGNNPAANSTTGMDGDKTKKVTRVWLSTSIAF
jgi:hemolysin activation/secretion protein